MTIQREDGPVKHYRMKCDKCGKQTKRFAYDFENDAPKGWQEDDWQKDGWDCKHYCPKCTSNNDQNNTNEIIPNNNDSFDLSDHERVHRPIVRKDDNTLVIDCQDGRYITISANTKITAQLTEE